MAEGDCGFWLAICRVRGNTPHKSYKPSYFYRRGDLHSMVANRGSRCCVAFYFAYRRQTTHVYLGDDDTPSHPERVGSIICWEGNFRDRWFWYAHRIMVSFV